MRLRLAATALLGTTGASCSTTSFMVSRWGTNISRTKSILPTTTPLLLQSASSFSLFRQGQHQQQQKHQQRQGGCSRTYGKLSSSSSSSSSTRLTPNDDPVAQVIAQESLQEMQKVVACCQARSPPVAKTHPLLLLETAAQVSSFVAENFDAILFDCDGVLYRGSHVLPGTAQALRQWIVQQQKRVFFVTNNAATSRSQLRDKLQTLLQLDPGVLTVDQMVPSSYAAARFLATQWSSSEPKQKSVHVIGAPGLRQEMQEAGFRVTFVSNEEEATMTRDDLAAYNFDDLYSSEDKMDALVMGLDTSFTYRKLCVATVLLQRNPEALLIATNQDAYDLVGVDARHLPGNGAVVAALQWASPHSQSNFYNVGKPSKILATWMQSQWNLNPTRTLMIGDRLDTDVAFGQVGGMTSALVLSGVTTATMLQSQLEAAAAQSKKEGGRNDAIVVPDVVFPHVGLLAHGNEEA